MAGSFWWPYRDDDAENCGLKKTKIRTRSNHSLSSAFVLTVDTAVWRGFTCLLFCQERLKLLVQLFVPENCFNYCSLVSYQKLFRFSPRSAQCNMSTRHSRWRRSGRWSIGKNSWSFPYGYTGQPRSHRNKLGSVLLKSQIRQYSPKVERNISRIFT